MPEGPEIRRAADAVQTAVAGQPLVDVRFAFDHLRPYEAELGASTIERVDTYGKAMVTRFANGMAIYSHNQLYGKWLVVGADTEPKTSRSLRLSLVTPTRKALLFSASEIDVLLGPKDEREHPFLSRLGPDLLTEDPTTAEIRSRLTSSRFRGRQLAALLLDQHFVAGLGNYLRADVLFKAKIAPAARAKDLDTQQQLRLCRAIRSVTRQSYETRGITNDLKRVARLQRRGLTRREVRHLVYGRDGEACWECSARIERQDLGGRAIFWCPSCQVTGGELKREFEAV